MRPGVRLSWAVLRPHRFTFYIDTSTSYVEKCYLYFPREEMLFFVLIFAFTLFFFIFVYSYVHTLFGSLLPSTLFLFLIGFVILGCEMAFNPLFLYWQMLRARSQASDTQECHRAIIFCISEDPVENLFSVENIKSIFHVGDSILKSKGKLTMLCRGVSI
jgi:energy-coupling factor transporter transmembrane protein EcfT